MLPAKRKTVIQCVLTCILLTLAWILGYLYDGSLYSVRKILGPFQTGIYVLVICMWANSVRWRIIQPYVRGCLELICAVMVLWLSLRSYKFFFAQSEDVVRFLWYSYYIGILFIPMLAFFAAVSIGEADDFLWKKRFLAMLGMTTLFVVMVLTNDLHQLVFSFPEDALVWNDSAYSYQWGYVLIIGWCSFCLLGALFVMLRKSRRHNRPFFRYLPFFPLLLLSVYLVAYAVYHVRFLFDLTVMCNLIFLLEFECCIQCGLIRSNTGYDILFEHGSYGAQIMNRECEVLQASDTAYELTLEQRRQALNKVIWPEANVRIKSHPIRNGYVLWKEDVTDLNTILEQLQDNNESIEESVAIEQESYETQRKISRLKEKNRLYDLLQSQTAGQIDMMDGLLSEYERSESEEEKQWLLAKLTVVGSYVKRRGNLLFIAEKSSRIDSGELALCLEESFVSLRLCGADCGLDLEKGHLLTAESAFAIYDLFEEVVELVMDNCRSFYLKARFEANPLVTFWVESNSDLSGLLGKWDLVKKEDGIWQLSFFLNQDGKKGGDVR